MMLDNVGPGELANVISEAKKRLYNSNVSTTRYTAM